MKISKLLILASALALVACNAQTSNTSESKEVTSSVEAASSSTATTTSDVTNSSSTNNTTSENQTTSSSVDTSLPVFDNIVTFNFVNPSCGTAKEKLNDTLKSYMNEVAKTTIVSAVSNTNCQIPANTPTKNNSVLVIGAQSSTGLLEFTFTQSIKMITVTAETHNKPYNDPSTGTLMPNVDTNSVLKVGSTQKDFPIGSFDLTPVDGAAVEKTVSVAINSTKLYFGSTTDDRGRVFIKELKICW